MNIVLEYLKYIFVAKGRHGTHSPFVYDLVDKCFRTDVPADIQHKFLEHRQGLMQEDSVIQVNDLGAGSKRMDNQRIVKTIAKTSGSSPKYAKILFQIAHYYQPKNTLELGTSVGLGTIRLAEGSKKGNVFTVEGCEATQMVAKLHLEKFGIDNVYYFNQSFEAFLTENEAIFDVVFIDGDHKGKKLARQLELLEKCTHDETIFILDDIRWTSDMLMTWKEICKQTNYHLTIDLFRMGIIVKREHQQKEHFVVRY